MENAFLAAEGFGEVADHGGAAADHDHFGAEMVIEVDVGRGEDGAVVVVLDVGELVAELSDVVVVEEGDGAEGLGVALPFALDDA